MLPSLKVFPIRWSTRSHNLLGMTLRDTVGRMHIPSSLVVHTRFPPDRRRAIDRPKHSLSELFGEDTLSLLMQPTPKRRKILCSRSLVDDPPFDAVAYCMKYLRYTVYDRSTTIDAPEHRIVIYILLTAPRMIDKLTIKIKELYCSHRERTKQERKSLQAS
jgi:hypothetical protein